MTANQRQQRLLPSADQGSNCTVSHTAHGQQGRKAFKPKGWALSLIVLPKAYPGFCVSLYKPQSFHKSLFCSSQQGYVLFTRKILDRYKKGSIARKKDLEEKQIIWECQNPEEISLLQPD